MNESFLSATSYKSHFIVDCVEDVPFPKETDKTAFKVQESVSLANV